jgi:hypothetical protein
MTESTGTSAAIDSSEMGQGLTEIVAYGPVVVVHPASA